MRGGVCGVDVFLRMALRSALEARETLESAIGVTIALRGLEVLASLALPVWMSRA